MSTDRISDDGELWSFIRRVLCQGEAIEMDSATGRFENYEEHQARLDEAARERVAELRAILSSPEPSHAGAVDALKSLRDAIRRAMDDGRAPWVRSSDLAALSDAAIAALRQQKASPPAQVAVPEGWNLALACPTDLMVDEGLTWLTHFAHMRKQDRRNALENAYIAMLASAPEPPK